MFTMLPFPKRFAVIGKPVFHSKSPIIFNTLFRRYEINAHYNCIAPVGHLPVEEIFQKLNLSFANVTTPFKESYYKELSQVSKIAELIEGVNIVYETSEGLYGDNSDGDGVLGALLEVISDCSCKSLVIGAGAAGRSAAYALKRYGFDVCISNRTISKAEYFARKIGVNVLPYSSLGAKLSEYKIIVIATTPEVDPLENADLSPGTVILNANYRKHKLKYNLESVKVIGGERWLFHQARAAFGKYFGFFPDIQIFEEAIEIQPGGIDSSIAYVMLQNPVFTWETSNRVVLFNKGDEHKAREWAMHELLLLK